MLQSYEAIFDHGTIRWLGDKPSVDTARIIVTMLAPIDSTQPMVKHKPSTRIAGQGRVLGDLLEPVIPASDWAVLE